MIAFIWQDDWNTTAQFLVKKLLAADHEVKFFIRNGQNGGRAARIALPAGATKMKSLAAALEQADTVLTLFNTAQEVEDVYLGENGILSTTTPGSLLIDLSTSSPRLARELNALAAVHDFCFVEAPLEGGYQQDGTEGLRILAAGEADSLKRGRPVLKILSTEVREVGLPGSATTLKLAQRIALAGTLMAVIESYAFALNSGLDEQTIRESLDQGITASTVQQVFGSRVFAEDFFGGIELRLFLNELTTAFDAASELNLTLPGLETAHQLYDMLVLVGGGQKGIHALALIYYDEQHSNEHGLNWELAQRAMEIYERIGDEYDDYDYDYDYDYDDYGDYDDDCDDPGCTDPHHHHGENGLPPMGRFFSPN